MAALAKYQTPELCAPIPDPSDRLPGLQANETLTAGDVVYIDSASNQYKKSVATNDTVASRFAVGIVPDDYFPGQACTAFQRARFHYGQTMTPGTRFYVSASVAGGLDTSAPYAGATPVAYALTPTVIQFFGNGLAVV